MTLKKSTIAIILTAWIVLIDVQLIAFYPRFREIVGQPLSPILMVGLLILTWVALVVVIKHISA